MACDRARCADCKDTHPGDHSFLFSRKPSYDDRARQKFNMPLPQRVHLPPFRTSKNGSCHDGDTDKGTPSHLVHGLVRLGEPLERPHAIVGLPVAKGQLLLYVAASRLVASVSLLVSLDRSL